MSVFYEVSILYEFGSEKDNNCKRRNVNSVKTGITLMSDCKHLLLQIHRDIERNAGLKPTLSEHPRKVEDQLTLPHLLKSPFPSVERKNFRMFCFLSGTIPNYLTLPTKINSRWIKNSNIRPETIHILEETWEKLIDNSLGGVWCCVYFFGLTSKAMATKAK